jgi:polar amino acid transport system permease protein
MKPPPPTASEGAGRLDGKITPQGRISAREVVVTTGGYTDRLVPRLHRAFLPIATYVMISREAAPDLIASAISHALTPSGTTAARATTTGWWMADGASCGAASITTRAASTEGLVRELHRDHDLTRLSAACRAEDRTGLVRSDVLCPAPDAPDRRNGCPRASGIAPPSAATASTPPSIGGKVVAEAILGQSDRVNLFRPFGLTWTGGPAGMDGRATDLLALSGDGCLARAQGLTRMHYKDNIDYPPMLTRPAVFVPLLVAVFAALWWFQAGDGALGRLVLGLVPGAEGNTAEPGDRRLRDGAGRLQYLRGDAPAAAPASLASLGRACRADPAVLLFVRPEPCLHRQRKIGFLITQGAVTTLYISAIVDRHRHGDRAHGGDCETVVERHRSWASRLLHLAVPRPAALMQIYMIYLGLPQLGYVVDAPFRQGSRAVAVLRRLYDRDFPRRDRKHPRGQWEAARALGIRRYR